MANLGHWYIWFVVFVALFAGLPRLLLSRRFAELQLAKLRQGNSISRALNMSVVIGIVGLLLVVGYFTAWGHGAWIKIAIIFSFLSAAEFFFQAKFPSLDSLVFQNRLLGILYLGLSAGSYVMLHKG